MSLRKKKIIGGREYMIVGSTIVPFGGKRSYTTNKGKVIVEDGVVTHPDGTKTPE